MASVYRDPFVSHLIIFPFLHTGCDDKVTVDRALEPQVTQLPASLATATCANLGYFTLKMQVQRLGTAITGPRYGHGFTELVGRTEL